MFSVFVFDVFILVLLNFYQIEPIFIMSSDSVSESNSARFGPKMKSKSLCVYLTKLEDVITYFTLIVRLPA
jgi:hypothetical protein